MHNRRKYQQDQLIFSLKLIGLLSFTAYNYALQNIYLYLCIAIHVYSHDAQMMTCNSSNLAHQTETKFDYSYVLQHIYTAIRLLYFYITTHTYIFALINNTHVQVIETSSS